jgi:hypothetical protein
MIKRMIKRIRQDVGWQGKQVSPGFMDDQGASDRKSDATQPSSSTVNAYGALGRATAEVKHMGR